MSGKSISRKKRAVRSCKSCTFIFSVDKSQCPSCGTWDAPLDLQEDGKDETFLLSEISETPLTRIRNTGPWDRCFSLARTIRPDGKFDEDTGIVTVQVALIGGAPGAGKSTLALQASDAISQQRNREVFYIAAEEAGAQIKDRSLRLKVKNPDRIRIYPLGASTDLGEIFRRRKPGAVIVDSMPGLTTDLEQAVEYCKAFKEYAVLLDCPFIVIDHVTKNEELAGLMALQHEVDTTMLFTVYDDAEKPEDRTRELTSIKNRMGPNQTVYLKMGETGLREAINTADDEDDDPDWT